MGIKLVNEAQIDALVDALASITTKLKNSQDSHSNLLLDSRDMNTLWGIHEQSYIKNGIATLNATGKLVALHQSKVNSNYLNELQSGTYTIGFDAKSNQTGTLQVRLRRQYNGGFSDVKQNITIDSREFKRYFVTLNYNKLEYQNGLDFEIVTYDKQGFVCDIKRPKLELGTNQSEWSDLHGVIGIKSKKDFIGHSLVSTDKYLSVNGFVIPMQYFKPTKLLVNNDQLKTQVTGNMGMPFMAYVPIINETDVDSSLWTVSEVPSGLSLEDGVLTGIPDATFNGTIRFMHPYLENGTQEIDIQILPAM